jgi:hypothetical protein
MQESDPINSWDAWLKEGQFVSYTRDNVRYYEQILYRDLARYVYHWPETVIAGSTSGPFVPSDIEITRGYDKTTGLNRIWQLIFGIKGQAYIYVQLPTDINRHGIPKVARPSAAHRDVAHFEEWMTPFREPSFITTHYLMRPDTLDIAFEAYNPETSDIPDLKLNVLMANMVTERIGTEYVDDAGSNRVTADKPKFEEIINKLYRRVVPFRPLTIMPVRAPAESPTGE